VKQPSAVVGLATCDPKENEHFHDPAAWVTVSANF
jgi:hypothetical protein